MKKAYWYAGISIFCWSTAATVTKFLLDTLNSMQLLWLSSALAFVALLIVNIISGNIRKLKEYPVRKTLISVLCGLPGTFFYYIFYYTGADMMPASQAFIINYMWPIMSVVFASIILKERLTVKKAVSVLVSFIGVGIITGEGILNFDSGIITGAGLCLAGAVSYGLFTALSRKTGYDKRIAMMLNYLVTFVLSTFINMYNGELFVPDMGDLPWFLWNGFLCIAIASTVWIYALEAGNTAVIANLAYITPFLSLVWTSVFLGEDVSTSSVVGLLFIVMGILGQFIRLPKRKRPFSENWEFKEERGIDKL